MNIWKNLEISSLFNIMSNNASSLTPSAPSPTPSAPSPTPSAQCPKCPVCSQNPVLDVAGNIFSKDLLIPMHFTKSTETVEPYNPQAQGVMQYHSSNVKNSFDAVTAMNNANKIYSLNAQIKDQIESILRRNFDLKTQNIPFSTRGENN